MACTVLWDNRPKVKASRYDSNLMMHPAYVINQESLNDVVQASDPTYVMVLSEMTSYCNLCTLAL